MNNNSSKIGLFPGGDGVNNYGWFDWLKGELLQSKRDVYIAEAQIISPVERAKILTAAHPVKQNSLLVGHSFGALTVMKMVEQISVTINGVVLVDPSVKESLTVPWSEGEDHHRVSYLESWDWAIDFAKIRTRVGKIIILSDTELGRLMKNWTAVHRDVYAKELGAELRVLKGMQKHFSAKEEPEVLKAVLDILENPV